jgi:succinate dehydrogenase flavin-adding protein (antitoxin of CptAB toxin-antitoxin module)
MKELDQLLGAWLAHRFPTASSAARRQFEQFLELPDPVIAGYLLGRECPADPEQSALVAEIVASRPSTPGSHH